MNQRGAAPTESPGSSDRTIFALLHAAHALEAKVEAALEKAGLSSPKYSVLCELVKAGQPLPLSELASRLSCVRSNMTQLVDRLEAEGLVQRVACPEDRRSVKAEITYLGRERQTAGDAEITRLHAEFAAAVPDSDRAAFERMLKALQ
jgi:DNA-binding MarR family transcriptional regulator